MFVVVVVVIIIVAIINIIIIIMVIITLFSHSLWHHIRLYVGRRENKPPAEEIHTQRTGQWPDCGRNSTFKTGRFLYNCDFYSCLPIIRKYRFCSSIIWWSLILFCNQPLRLHRGRVTWFSNKNYNNFAEVIVAPSFR